MCSVNDLEVFFIATLPIFYNWLKLSGHLRLVIIAEEHEFAILYTSSNFDWLLSD